MDKAKAAVNTFLHKSGHHDTTVHETVAPSVVNETVTPTRHEETLTAVDREIHQDHYHTTVQPVQDREILPEKHHHRMGAVETREHKHGDESAVKARLEREAAQFQHTRTEGATTHTTSVAPVVEGEHIHHHVHELIQPVVQKETIQPSVVHTTIPVHEVHYNEAKHHAASALPAISMADYKAQGGVLGGREQRMDGFEGEPRAIGSSLGGGHNGNVTGDGIGGNNYNNTTGSGLENRAEADMLNKTEGRTTRSQAGGLSGNNTTSGLGNDNGMETTTKKPSLLDRINPMKDT